MNWTGLLGILCFLSYFNHAVCDGFEPVIKFHQEPLPFQKELLPVLISGGPKSIAEERAKHFTPLLHTPEGLLILGYHHGPPDDVPHGLQLPDQFYEYGSDIDGLFLALNPKLEGKGQVIKAIGPTVHVTGHPVAKVPDKNVLLGLYLDGKHVDGLADPRLKSFFIHSAPHQGYHVHSKTGPVFLPPPVISSHGPPVLFDPVQGVIVLKGPPVLEIPKVSVTTTTKTVVAGGITAGGKKIAQPLGVTYSNPPVYNDYGKGGHGHGVIGRVPPFVDHVPHFFYFMAGGICP